LFFGIYAIKAMLNVAAKEMACLPCAPSFLTLQRLKGFFGRENKPGKKGGCSEARRWA
jgi:hypothetical protein